MSDEILVTIQCLVYNHEPYLRKCLDGFVKQKTSFKFEALVHDDASTDSSAVIIKEYASKYPEIIKPIYQTENQYSKGVDFVESSILPLARGKYIAFCEGDDFWIDENKLQKQVEAMEQNPSIDISAHSQYTCDAISEKYIGETSHGKSQRIFSVEDVILGEGGFVGTNTLMLRSSAYFNKLPFRSIINYDYTIQIQGSLRGGLLYLPEYMSVYRYGVPNSYCSKLRKNPELLKNINDTKERMLNQLNADTKEEYNGIIYARLLLTLVSPYNSFRLNTYFLKRYYVGVKFLSLGNIIRVLFRWLFPSIMRLRMRIADVI